MSLINFLPPEHSHEAQLRSVRTSLQLNNPNQIQDPVFGLLGNAAAAAGAGKITVSCVCDDLLPSLMRYLGS